MVGVSALESAVKRNPQVRVIFPVKEMNGKR